MLKRRTKIFLLNYSKIGKKRRLKLRHLMISFIEKVKHGLNYDYFGDETSPPPLPTDMVLLLNE
jgi:hypothetical protein